MKSHLADGDSSAVIVSTYEDELKFLLKDEVQLSEIYNLVKSQPLAIVEQTKEHRDIYLDSCDFDLHRTGTSCRVRQSESAGGKKFSLDLKVKLHSSDNNESGIYRRREAAREISFDEKEQLINGALIQEVVPDFYSILCEMTRLECVDLAVKFEVLTKRSVLSATVDDTTQIIMNFDIIIFDPLHTYYELEVKYSTTQQSEPEVLEAIQDKFSLVRWDKSKCDRGVYLYQRKYFRENASLRNIDLSPEDSLHDIFRRVYGDFIFHLPYFQREDKKITDELYDLQHRSRSSDQYLIHSFRSRIKDPSHLISKLIRKRDRYFSSMVAVTDSIIETSLSDDNYLRIITDLIGVRILHLFKDDWLQIDEQLKDLYKDKIVEKKFYLRKGDEIQGQKHLKELLESRGFDFIEKESGYRSAHYLIERSTHVDSGDVLTMYAEIQVRTIFEEAWGEVDHQVKYPNFQDCESINNLLKIFNRSVGANDEMATYIRMLRNSIEEKSK